MSELQLFLDGEKDHLEVSEINIENFQVNFGRFQNITFLSLRQVVIESFLGIDQLKFLKSIEIHDSDLINCDFQIFSQMPNLRSLRIEEGTEIKKIIDLSNNQYLTDLYLENECHQYELDITGADNLIDLHLYGNIKVRHNKLEKLEYLTLLYNNQYKEINLSFFPQLKELTISKDILISLNSNLYSLEVFYCASGNARLKGLEFRHYKKRVKQSIELIRFFLLRRSLLYLWEKFFTQQLDKQEFNRFSFLAS